MATLKTLLLLHKENYISMKFFIQEQQHSFNMKLLSE